MPGTGIAQYTQQEITNGLNRLAERKPEAKPITRATVNRAIKALCTYNWLERVGNGKIRLNVRLWFQGNSASQQRVLEQIADAHDHDPRAFPYSVGPAEGHQEALDLGLEGDAGDSYGKGARTG